MPKSRLPRDVAQKTDSDLKEEGNAFFSRKRYESAINCYTKAIEKNSLVTTYFTNRALCYLKLKQWEQVIVDCRSAIEIDPSCLKGHAFLGVALIELEYYDEAMTHLQRADNLSKEKKIDVGISIMKELKRVRELKWEQKQKVEQDQAVKLLSFLTQLMDKHKTESISKIQIPSDGQVDTKKYEDSVATIKKQHEQYTEQLQTIFVKNCNSLMNREVPDYFCDKISCDILQDPVITPSGITYDRKCLEEHFEKVGQFDPVSRKPLTADQLIPNLALREAVNEFAKVNEFVNYCCDL